MKHEALEGDPGSEDAVESRYSGLLAALSGAPAADTFKSLQAEGGAFLAAAGTMSRMRVSDARSAAKLNATARRRRLVTALTLGSSLIWPPVHRPG